MQRGAGGIPRRGRLSAVAFWAAACLLLAARLLVLSGVAVSQLTIRRRVTGERLSDAEAWRRMELRMAEARGSTAASGPTFGATGERVAPPEGVHSALDAVLDVSQVATQLPPWAYGAWLVVGAPRHGEAAVEAAATRGSGAYDAVLLRLGWQHPSRWGVAHPDLYPRGLPALAHALRCRSGARLVMEVSAFVPASDEAYSQLLADKMVIRAGGRPLSVHHAGDGRFLMRHGAVLDFTSATTREWATARLQAVLMAHSGGPAATADSAVGWGAVGLRVDCADTALATVRDAVDASGRHVSGPELAAACYRWFADMGRDTVGPSFVLAAAVSYAQDADVAAVARGSAPQSDGTAHPGVAPVDAVGVATTTRAAGPTFAALRSTLREMAAHGLQRGFDAAAPLLGASADDDASDAVDDAELAAKAAAAAYAALRASDTAGAGAAGDGISFVDDDAVRTAPGASAGTVEGPRPFAAVSGHRLDEEGRVAARSRWEAAVRWAQVCAVLPAMHVPTWLPAALAPHRPGRDPTPLADSGNPLTSLLDLHAQLRAYFATIATEVFAARVLLGPDRLAESALDPRGALAADEPVVPLDQWRRPPIRYVVWHAATHAVHFGPPLHWEFFVGPQLLFAPVVYGGGVRERLVAFPTEGGNAAATSWYLPMRPWQRFTAGVVAAFADVGPSDLLLFRRAGGVLPLLLRFYDLFPTLTRRFPLPVECAAPDLAAASNASRDDAWHEVVIFSVDDVVPSRGTPPAATNRAEGRTARLRAERMEWHHADPAAHDTAPDVSSSIRIKATRAAVDAQFAWVFAGSDARGNETTPHVPAAAPDQAEVSDSDLLALYSGARMRGLATAGVTDCTCRASPTAQEADATTASEDTTEGPTVRCSLIASSAHAVDAATANRIAAGELAFWQQAASALHVGRRGPASPHDPTPGLSCAAVAAPTHVDYAFPVRTLDAAALENALSDSQGAAAKPSAMRRVADLVGALLAASDEPTSRSEEQNVDPRTDILLLVATHTGLNSAASLHASCSCALRLE